MTGTVGDAGAAAEMASWRPMGFGRRPAREIRDPLMEPLWPGRRVLIHLVAGSRPRICDEQGLELAGHPDLQGALLGAARADELILDGYLLPLPPLDAPLTVASPDPDVPGVAAATRHLFIGTRPGGRRRADPAAVLAAGPGGAAGGSQGAALTFVAVDLLALDGESLADVPLLERKRLLDATIATGELVRLSPHVRLPATNWHRQWRSLGFREMAVKDANSRYRPGEASPDWSVATIPTR